MKTQGGFSYVIVLIAVAIVSVVGFAGWRVYDATNKTSQDAASVTTNQNSSTQVNPIESANDVAAVEQELTAIDIDAELDISALDAEIKELQ